MDGGHALFLSDVIHQALVRVDGEGTEAAPATAVIAAMGAPPAVIPTVVLERPFIFLIVDQKTASVLFLIVDQKTVSVLVLGRALDPRE